MQLKNALNSTTGMVKGRVLVVPSAKDKSSFMKYACEHKWIESVLNYSAPSTEEGAEWLSYYMAKRHEVSFLVSAKDCGLPVIHQMDASTAAAMIANANLTRTQQCIISKYMWYDFGSQVIVPESKQVDLGQHHRHPSAFYSSYTHESEEIDYLYFNLTEVLLSEVKVFMENLHGNFSELRPYKNMKGDLG
jgi:hypothetical protein